MPICVAETIKTKVHSYKKKLYTVDSNNLRIDNPCPFIPTRFNKKNKNEFYCKSCAKDIIDFRNQSSEEITKNLKPGTCGIFTSNQLPGQKKLKFKGKVLLYFFSVLSILGFAIKPLSAQNLTTETEDSIKITQYKGKAYLKKPTKKELKIAKKRNKKLSLFGRKKRFTSGCPRF